MHLSLGIGISSQCRTAGYGAGAVQVQLIYGPLDTCHFKIVKNAVRVLNE